MKRIPPFFVPGILLAAILLLVVSVCSGALPQQAPIPVHPSIDLNYSKLPLYFEFNQGQTHSAVRFLARGPGYALFLTPTEAVLALTHPRPRPQGRISGSSPPPAGNFPARVNESAVLRLQVAGASPEASISGLRQSPGKVHYLKGNDPAKWRQNIPLYEAVRYANILPGIDLVYYGRDGRLEYDFLVSPGADPGVIKLKVEGPGKIRLDSQGNILMQAGAFEWVMHSPRIYQERDGKPVPVEGRFVLLDRNCIGFHLGPYDAKLPLVIDPVLGYSTLLGGHTVESGYDEEGRGIAVDAAGCAYITGQTYSNDFPTTSGAWDTTYKGNGEVFVTKMNPQGSGLVYSTYVGGYSEDWAHCLVLDSANQAIVTGYTRSFDFPTTEGAYQPVKADGASNKADAYVFKLNPSGSSLVFSTFLGGDQEDWGEGITLDADENIYVTGITYSPVFPTSATAFQKINMGNGDAYVVKLNPTASALRYGTFLGGSTQEYGFGIAVDSFGCAYVTGRTNSDNYPTTTGAYQESYHHGNMDAFVTKLNFDGSNLLYSTYLGGTGYDFGHGIALNSQGNAYITGGSASVDFPTTSGAFQTTNNGPIMAFPGGGDAFVAQLNTAGSALVFSTLLGGLNHPDEGHGIVLDPQGNVYVTGLTWSYDFPLMNPIQALHQQGGTGVNADDAFITRLNPVGSKLLFSTYLGGINHDWGHAITLDSKGRIYIVGDTTSVDFPVTPNAYQKTANRTDAFIARIDLASSGLPATLFLLLD